jgi:ATP-dependent helicase/nuclease subunit B
MSKDFFSNLGKNTTVLTANRRLASYLQRQYGQYQRNLGKTAWPIANILPLNSWINQQWTLSDNRLMLLSPLQESSLWREISQKNAATIPAMQQAWNHLHAWKIPLETIASSYHHAVQSFYQWATTLQDHCRKNQWITAAELTMALSLDAIDLPEKIILAGFDDHSPAHQDLLVRLGDCCTVTTLNPPSCAHTVKRYQLDHTESELQHMAQWAHQLHQTDTHLKIACVIPNLTAIRHDVVRIFSAKFNDPMSYNIAAGQRLNTLPIIQAALKAINNQWPSLLQSPYIATNEADIEIGAASDKMRRDNNIKDITPPSLLPILTKLQSQFPESTLLKRSNTLHQHQNNQPKQQTLTQWLTDFIESLHILQWPGHRSLNSIEQQIVNRWNKAIEELTECDEIIGMLDNQQAYQILEGHIEQIIFQEKSQNSPIQILGSLETAGMSFDHLWLMGLDNESWPAASAANPFLPYQLQREHNMPHASAQRELLFTQATQKRLINSAPCIYLSSANQSGDKRLTPSKLIVHYPLSQPEDLPQDSNPIENSHIENLSDNQARKMTDNEKVRGGTYILKLQSICPFKAFASLRLKADPLEQPQTGLSARERGQILHAVLERLWRQLKSQQTLIDMDDQQLDQVITTAIHQVISTSDQTNERHAFLKIEQQRLIRIIYDWLAVEKKREPFTVIANEDQRGITIGKLSFQCRIDRIDQLANGEQLVIDYKSGHTRINDWYGERPADPQLPVYCVFGQKENVYDGMAFAQVRAGDMQFKAVLSDDTDQFPEDTENWAELTTQWQTKLTALSDDFYEGHAEVDPLITACDHCELKPLCRVEECQTP